MRRIIAGTLALTVLSSTWLLGSEGATKAKKPVKKAPPPVSAQMQQMQDQLNQQQQQINQLQQQLQQSNSQLQSTQSQLQGSIQQANQQSAAAQQAASAAQQTANSLNSSVVDLKTSTATFNQSLTVVQKDVKDLLNPLSVRYKGIKISPYGFLEGDAFWRSRAVLNDTPTNYQTVPLNGTPLAAMNEFRMTARNTIIGFTTTADAGTAKINGYFAVDFNAGNLVGQTYTSSDNWTPRIRWAAGEVQTASGWRVLGGMYRTIDDLNRKLINPLTEWGPTGMDNSSFTGIGTFRMPVFRVTKNFAKDKWAVAIEVAQPDFLYTNDAATSQYLAGIPAPNLTSPTILNGNVTTGANISVANPTLPVTPTCAITNAQAAGSVALTGNSFGCVNNLAAQKTSIPIAPDIWVKLATDQKFGHFEVKGLVRFFRDRLLTPVNTPSATTAPILSNAGTNHISEGGGVGFAAVVPVTKKIDFLVNSLAGVGIGRYLSSNTADVTLSGMNANGVGACPATNLVPSTATCSNKLVGIRSAGGMSGLEFHPTPKFDLNIYYGLEYYQRSNNSATYIGNGYGDARNAPSTSSGTNANGGDNKSINQFMVTPVYRLYRGSYGTFQAMLSGQYSLRTTWEQSLSAAGKCVPTNGSPWTLNGNNCTGKGGEVVGVFALRYILP
jgi:hypothetical protein